MALGYAETVEYLESFELFLASSIARQAWGEHVCMAKFEPTPNGSPETLVDDGVEAGAKVTGAWVNQLCKALEPAQTEFAILSVLQRFESNGFRLEDFAKVTADKLLRGCLLGALDSKWERETGELVEQVKFALNPIPANVTGGTYDQVLKHWDSQQALTRPAFDALEAGTKRKAFTVARMASSELLDTTHAELRRQIELGRTGGQTEGLALRDFHKFAKQRLESAGWTPASASHVETIFRTNVISAYSSGRFTEMRQPAVMAALPYWQILAVKDPRTRDTHRAASGTVLRADDAFWKHAYPPFGYNCLLPGTEVRGRFVGASRAMYSGQAVEFTSAKGRRLSVTANHPVLTAHGLVPATQLREGDQLLGYAGYPGFRETDHDNKDNGPAKVEQIFGALAHGGRDITTTGRLDFHGDAEFFKGKIDVVGSYRALANDANAASLNQLSDRQLKAADLLGLALSSCGERLIRIALSSPRFPRTANLLRSFARSDARPFEIFSAGAIAEFDAFILEQPHHCRPGHAGNARELFGRITGPVERDIVSSVRRFEFVGHVYDLEAENGWMFANGISISNCRCKVCARTKAWLERNSKSVGPTPHGLPDPGFDSGTKTLIAVPDAALAPAPTEQQQAPAAPPARPPGLGPPSPFPAVSPFAPPMATPSLLAPVEPGQAPTLGPASPFVTYAPSEPVVLPQVQPAVVAPPSLIPARPPGLGPPSPFPDRPAPITQSEIDKAKNSFSAKARAVDKLLGEHAHAGALRAYTGSMHEEINYLLRGNRRKVAEGITAQLYAQRVESTMLAAKNASALLVDAERAGKAVQGVVYRGLNASPALLGQLQTQSEFIFEGFTSTTVSEKTAKSFSLGEHGNGRVLLRIRQRSAIPISKLSNVPEEKEALLRPGLRFRVIARSTEAPFHVIDLEQIE